MPPALDNPFWASLTTLHRPLAREVDGVVGLPAEVAPFLAIPEPRPVSARALAELVPDQNGAFLLGPRPDVPAGWRLDELGTILQMVCDGPLPAVEGPSIEELAAADRGHVLALAALVYPHYFRERTTDLGRYFGVRGPDRLDAMVGERMGMPGLREVSAVCTHPGAVGRGLARRLLAHLSNDLFARGITPFLHVSPANTRALAIYERNGYRRRLELPFWGVQRTG
ncbi:MAG: GNAT family N-acetyltransferase [Deltaproteobacteria bacterium]|nr:GNAT family N-acetyltransferase [Deltaproteobacteria bacterium]